MLIYIHVQKFTGNGNSKRSKQIPEVEHGEIVS